MRATPRTIALTIAASTLLTMTGIAPVLAAPSDAEVGAAYGVMLTKQDAAVLGMRGDTLRSFGVTTSDKGTPDAPWLCDLTGPAEVEGKGARTLFSSELLALRNESISEATQEIHSYASAGLAKRAYDDVATKVKQCTGQHQPAQDDEADGADGMTTKLTNGVRTSDRGTFIWVRSQTTIAGTEGFVSHQYLTVRLVGPYLQVIEIESEGTSAPDLTPKAIKAADALTITLGDLWRTS